MGNVYMEANQVRFKGSTYHNVQEGLAAALEGGGGGGTTVVANPEGSATADLAKLQVGTTIYGIPETAAKVAYDNTGSGLTADDVQEAIDELNTGLSGVTELIPSGATSSNKLATASDIPGTATTSAAGIVQPDGTTITISDGVISAAGSSARYYTETVTVNPGDYTAWGDLFSASKTITIGESLVNKKIFITSICSVSDYAAMYSYSYTSNNNELKVRFVRPSAPAQAETFTVNIMVV